MGYRCTLCRDMDTGGTLHGVLASSGKHGGVGMEKPAAESVVVLRLFFGNRGSGRNMVPDALS